MRRGNHAFALWEVLLGLLIFSIGVITIGKSVQNCLNASTLSLEEDRVRQILSNRMAEIQATPGFPDASKETKIDTGYGIVTLVQKSVPATLKDEKDLEISGINRVTLTVLWSRGGADQSKRVDFYVYRTG